MTDLKLIGTEGEYLLFETQNRETFRAVIDEQLRNAIRNPEGRATNSVNMEPREIQALVRSGMTVEEVIGKSGDPRHYVEKFAAPVIDELSHIVASALSVRISVAGDRHTDISHIEFGEIIGARLETSQATSITWRARRDENHTWLVTVTFQIAGEENSATWSFEPKRMVLSPENDTAIKLSTQDSLTTYQPLKVANANTPKEPEQSLTESLADTQLVDTVIPIGRATDFEAQEPIEPATDLLEALKRKRAERANRDAEVIEPENFTTSIPVVAEISSQNLAGEENQDVPEEIQPNPAPVRRAGRPSIPTFDEIVQGTKSEEE